MKKLKSIKNLDLKTGRPVAPSPGFDAEISKVRQFIEANTNYPYPSVKFHAAEYGQPDEIEICFGMTHWRDDPTDQGKSGRMLAISGTASLYVVADDPDLPRRLCEVVDAIAKVRRDGEARRFARDFAA